jgi:hypothetical protein
MPADFKNHSQFRAWLGKQPREVAVALAARAALRVLPVVQTAKYEASTGVLIVPVFRATVISWAAAKYPAHQMELAAAAADAYAAAVAAAAVVVVAAATADAAAIRADAYAHTVAAAAARGADAYAAVAAAAAADAAAARGADAHAAVTATRAAAASARTAAARGADAYAAVTHAVAYAGDAACAAASADARTYAVTAAYTDAHTYPVAAVDTNAAAYAAAAAAPFFWSALSIDATRLENGAPAAVIANSPLWPQGLPDWLQSLWQEMKAALLAAKQDRQVWTNWYDDLLDGRVREEERELAYVRIDEALWNQGPAIVNAEIKRRIDECEPLTLV